MRLRPRAGGVHPRPFIRTNDFPRITKDNTQNNHLYAVWQDYRNGEFDIQLVDARTTAV